MNYRVIFSPEAEEQTATLYRYIASEASPNIAARYTEAIIQYCEGLTVFPYRGVMRDDVRPGLRLTNYKSRVAIAYVVEGNLVSILGIFYGGQNYEMLLQSSSEEDSKP